MAKPPHIIWVCPDSRSFYRSKGEIKCRPGSVIPKLAEKGMRINVLIPYDSNLLPKTKLTPSRTTHHTIRLSQEFPVDIVKLTRGALSPGIYMAKLPVLDAALSRAIFSKAGIALARQLREPVNVFHLFDWETAMLPLFLELEKNGSKIFSDTRTFLNIHSLKDQGNFAPAILSYLGIPNTLFHPQGIEFFGQVSFLKSGLLFSDGVGLIESSPTTKMSGYRNGTGLEGVLDSLMFKLRRWASERSLRSHLETYDELLTMPKRQPLLPTLIEKLHADTEEAESYIESWGPLLPDNYNKDQIGFLVQSPQKAYAYWEWTGRSHKEFGLFLNDKTSCNRKLLARNLAPLLDYWFDVEPDHEYELEFVGWKESGAMETLLTSRSVRIPRSSPSPNTRSTFIDIRTRRRFYTNGTKGWNHLLPMLMSSGRWELSSSRVEK